MHVQELLGSIGIAFTLRVQLLSGASALALYVLFEFGFWLCGTLII